MMLELLCLICFIIKLVDKIMSQHRHKKKEVKGILKHIMMISCTLERVGYKEIHYSNQFHITEHVLKLEFHRNFVSVTSERER